MLSPFGILTGLAVFTFVNEGVDAVSVLEGVSEVATDMARRELAFEHAVVLARDFHLDTVERANGGQQHTQ
ncbi:hypothetical protein F442_21272 [Phytophthora nicotianae P10297]|uniref:Uncharacterized protein n=1 Tax=Phytophthora nicotianae P10297 TaxID=1317064 RepID=W2Y4F5_PHYNI|nr:hypothetical protein F442_21272 [Phytophthora nicotianae P10297]